MRKFLRFFFTIIIGAIAGALVFALLVPYLSHTSPFNKVNWFKGLDSGTTIVNPVEEKIIKEDTAIGDVISKLNSSVVGIVSKSLPLSRKTPVEMYGTGFVVTGDGLVVADSSVVPAKGFDTSIVKNGDKFSAEVVKRDDKTGLVLLKVKESNLPVVSFVDLQNLRLGERVVLIGVDASESPAVKFVNWGILRLISENEIVSTISQEEIIASGAPLINVAGQVIGLCLIDKNGVITIVPAGKIKQFLAEPANSL